MHFPATTLPGARGKCGRSSDLGRTVDPLPKGELEIPEFDGKNSRKLHMYPYLMVRTHGLLLVSFP
jgi:hypothetical protein